MNADDGASCGAGKICISGACLDDACGDGFVSPGEECDDANMVNGDGCDSCKFSCVSDDPARNCAGLDPCVGTTTCDDVTHTCGDPVGDGEVCAMASVCVNGACTVIVCGDGVMHPGEACDDGNLVDGDGCQSDCTLLPPGSVCGNGVREAGEQCDDSNMKKLDGCDSACKFEQVQRATWLKMQFGTEAPFCSANRLGSAISAAAQGQIQTSLDDGVKNGAINILFKTLGLGDLSGNADPVVEIGVLKGAPIVPAGTMYNGTADLDWWYKIDPLSIDANRDPLEKLPGFISAKTLTAGPGQLSIGINLAGAPATLKMSNARLTASVGAVSTPLTSAGNPPGHLASENLDPALQSFASNGQPTEMDAGRLCGNVGAASLDQVPVPADLIVGGMLACDQKYTAQNSLLDVIVGGCTVFGFVSVIVPSQPDQADPNAPVAGAGGPYKLAANAMTKAVSSCRDANNQTVDFNTCLNAAAYSSFFKFATGRVIAK
jgi:cysteine-rich repeat protein